MSSRVSGNVRGLHGLRSKLKRIPVQAALNTARAAAPAITRQAGSSYDSGQTVYGAARPKGVRGNALTLVSSGLTRKLLRFVSDGTTTIRASLGMRYVKYLIGKYAILPGGPRAALPLPWRRRINQIALDECGEATWKELQL